MVCKNYSSLLLCYKKLSPKKKELISIIIILLSFIFIYLGLIYIPFYMGLNFGKVLFVLNILYCLIILICNLVLFFCRYKNIINTICSDCAYITSLTEFFIALFGLLTNLFDDIIILSKIRNNSSSGNYEKLSNSEIWGTFIIILVLLFIWINLFFLAILENIMIKLRINGNYVEYINALEDEKKYEENIEKNEGFSSKDNNDINVGIHNENKDKDINEGNNNNNQNDFNVNNNNENKKEKNVNDLISITASINKVFGQNYIDDNLAKNEQ